MFVHDGQTIPQAPPLSPGDEETYGVYWGDWLQADESITSSVWESDLTLGRESTDVSVTDEGRSYPHTNLVSVTGAVAGQTYRLSNTVTTAGRRETRSMRISCRLL